LDPPLPQDFGSYIQDENLPQLDLQGLFDDAMDVKRKVFDDSLVSVLYFFSYILRWRSCIISFIVSAALLSSCVVSEFIVPILFGLNAFFMMCLAVTPLRLSMTTGGLNAPYNYEGFSRVAAWGSTPHMVSYMNRVVTDCLFGNVLDVQHAYVLSSRIFRECKPVVDFEDLKKTIRQASKKENTNKAPWFLLGERDLIKGDLVLVDNRRHATVINTRAPNQDGDKAVMVEFEKDLSLGLTASKEPVAVAIARLDLRPSIPRIPSALIPDPIENHIKTLHIHIDEVKMSLFPLLKKIGDVLSWQNKCISALVTIVLLALCANTAYGKMQDDDEDPKDGEIMKVVKTILVYVDDVVFLLIFGYILFGQAPWFQAIRSIFCIAIRKVTMKRKAPELWAFFKEDGDEFINNETSKTYVALPTSPTEQAFV